MTYTTKNEITIRGPIIHKFYCEENRACVLTIATCVTRYKGRSDRNSSYESESCYPTINFFDDLADYVNTNYREGEHVFARGSLKSFLNRHTEKFEQAIRGNDISKSPNIINHTFDEGHGREYMQPHSSIAFKGVITSVIPIPSKIIGSKRPMGYSFLLDVGKNGYHNKIALTYYTSGQNPLPCEMTKGLEVLCNGYIKTRKVPFGEYFKYYETFVITDLCLSEKCSRNISGKEAG